MSSVHRLVVGCALAMAVACQWWLAEAGSAATKKNRVPVGDASSRSRRDRSACRSRAAANELGSAAVCARRGRSVPLRALAARHDRQLAREFASFVGRRRGRRLRDAECPMRAWALPQPQRSPVQRRLKSRCLSLQTPGSSQRRLRPSHLIPVSRRPGVPDLPPVEPIEAWTPVAAVPAQATEADIFVRMSGSDSAGDGSRAKPYQTLGRALDAAGAGGVVIEIGAGVYPRERDFTPRTDG